MHRTLAAASVLTITALLLPAAVSSTASSAPASNATVALLERPAGLADQLPPAVARLVDAKEVDVSTVRLGATVGSQQFYVAQGARGLCLIRVDDPAEPAFTTTCASTLIAGGVYLASLDRSAGTMQLADVVPDDVTRASVAGKEIGVSNNLLVTGDIPIGAPVSVIGASGARQVPVASSTSSLQTASG